MLTACKGAPASLAWSISNPNGSVEVWKPIWQFYTQTLGTMKAWWKDVTENMPDFASVDMALNLYWTGKNKTVTLLISPAQSTSFWKMSRPDIYLGRGRDDFIFDGSWQEGSQGG